MNAEICKKCKNHLSIGCEWIDGRYRYEQLSLTCKNSFEGNIIFDIDLSEEISLSIIKELRDMGEERKQIEKLKVFSQIPVPSKCLCYTEQLILDLNDKRGVGG